MDEYKTTYLVQLILLIISKGMYYYEFICST